jgi:hypothetical protein
MCSILCWILSIWEAPGCMFLFGLIHALPTRGRIVSPIHNMGWDAFCITRGRVLYHGVEKVGYSVQGENLGLHAFVQGSLDSCRGSSLCRLILFCALLFYRWYRALLPRLEELTVLSILSQLCWVVALALVDRDFLIQVIMFFCFCLAFDHLFEFFVRFFSFSFFYYYWLCVLSIHSSRGRLRTRASEDRWMVAPCCDEWLTTWCGLTLGRVLQVQVAAWFALVQVKSGRERS